MRNLLLASGALVAVKTVKQIDSTNMEETMPSISKISTVISHIYRAATDPDSWSEVLKEISLLVDAQAAVMVYQDKEVQHASGFASYGVSDYWANRYAEYYGSIDICFALMADKPVGKTFNILRPETPEISSHEFYTDFLNPQGVYYLSGANIIVDESRIAGLGLHRSLNAGEMNAELLELVDALIPHIQQSLDIQRKFVTLNLNNGLTQDSILDENFGFILFDNLAHPVYLNQIATQLVESNTAIRIEENQMIAADPSQTVNLRKIVMEAVQGDVTKNLNAGSALGINRTNSQRPLPVLIAPIRSSGFAKGIVSEGVQIRAAMFFGDTEYTRDIPSQVLTKIYGLSRNEAKVAIDIANGLSIEEIASSHYRSVNTVKTQLRSVFKKTNTTRQSELIKVLLSSPFHLHNHDTMHEQDRTPVDNG